MTNINRSLNNLHFSILGFVFLNFIIEYVTNYGLNSKLIFVLKIIIYLSGIGLFFLNRKPFKKVALYYFYYILTVVIGILFWLSGGIFLAILSSIVLKPIYPKEINYQKNNLKVYTNFNGFFAACCEYEIAENKLLIFEKHIGKIKVEGQIEAEKSDIKIIDNVVEYKHKIINYGNEIETEKDTIERIKIE